MHKQSRNILGFTYMVILGLVLPIYGIGQVEPLGDIKVTITFANDPSASLSVEKAYLKYNKDFAIVLQMNDGKEDIFTKVYPYFTGKNGNPGLYFTDGVTNSIPFKMSTVHYTRNQNGVDMHGGQNSWLTWDQMMELWAAEFGIESMGFINPPGSDEYYDVNRNISYTRKKTAAFAEPNGIGMDIYVVPNFPTHIPFAKEAGNLAIYHTGAGATPDPVQLESYFGSYYNMEISRTEITNNLLNDITTIAEASADGSHWLGTFFTNYFDGFPGIEFVLFKSIMNQVAAAYGAEGLDNMWSCSSTEAFEYLVLRERLSLNQNLNGNVLEITLSADDYPPDFRWYALSLVVNSDEFITDLQVEGAGFSSFKHDGDSALINLAWDGRIVESPESVAQHYIQLAENLPNSINCEIAADYVEIIAHPDTFQLYQIQLCDICSEVLQSFCLIFDIPDDTICKDASTTLTVPEVMDGYLWNTGETTQSIVVSPPETTKYWVTGSSGGATYTDTVTVVVLPYPDYSHSPDTAKLVLGNEITLWVSGGVSWKWSDASTDTAITVQPTSNTSYWCEITDENGCTVVQDYYVLVKYFVIDDVEICRNESATLSAPPDMGSYSWSTGDTTRSITVSPEVTTDYWVEVLTLDQGFQRDTATVTVLPAPEIIDASPDTLLLEPGTSDNLWVHANPGNSYLWNTGSTDTIVPVNTLINLRYWVDITNEIGCVTRLNFYVLVNYNTHVQFTFDSVCVGEMTRLTNLTTSNDEVVDVSWDLNSDGIFGDASGDVVFQNFPAADYYLVGMRITFKSGNLDVVFNSVPVGDLPLVDFDYENSCFGSATSFTDISSVSVGDINQRVWDYGDGHIDTILLSPAASKFYDNTGEYSVKLEVSSSIGCTASTSKLIKVVNPPYFTYVTLGGTTIGNGDTIAIAEGDSLGMTILDITAYDSLIWDGRYKQLIYYVKEKGRYDTDVYISNCFTSQYFFIVFGGSPQPSGEVIMNLFTPNGDGINDLWLVNDPGISYPIRVNIYNRYGNLVYSSGSYNNDWGGVFNGNPLPQSTYYYVIEDALGNTFKGPVSIVR